MCLKNKHSYRHNIQGIGLDSLTKVDREMEVVKLIKLLTELGEEPEKAFSRPHGKVEGMLGMSSRSLHCKDGHEEGDLSRNKIIVAPWRVLTGRVLAKGGREVVVSAKAHSLTLEQPARLASKRRCQRNRYATKESRAKEEAGRESRDKNAISNNQIDRENKLQNIREA